VDFLLTAGTGRSLSSEMISQVNPTSGRGKNLLDLTQKCGTFRRLREMGGLRDCKSASLLLLRHLNLCARRPPHASWQHDTGLVGLASRTRQPVPRTNDHTAESHYKTCLNSHMNTRAYAYARLIYCHGIVDLFLVHAWYLFPRS
jgi:hypothetical protein